MDLDRITDLFDDLGIGYQVETTNAGTDVVITVINILETVSIKVMFQFNSSGEFYNYRYRV